MELVIYLECIKKEKPPFRGVFKWRWEAELNRCKRICSPRPNRSAIPPVKWCVVYQKLFAPVNREKLWGSRPQFAIINDTRFQSTSNLHIARLPNTRHQVKIGE